jgi:hypothetical protein
MADNPIAFFKLEDIPRDVNIERKVQKLPPVLQRQLGGISCRVGRINVRGDGNCGYHVIQLLEYMINNAVRPLEYLQAVRAEGIMSTRLEHKHKLSLTAAKKHYLEYLEVGMILDRLMPNLNVGVIVQSNIKKSGDKRQRRSYPVRVVNYSQNQQWVFLLMSHGARHYELLTAQEMGRQRAVFTVKEAREIFEACSVEYPQDKVDAKEQLVFLDPDDFYYF